MKSAEYVGSVVAAYRYVIDHWKEDRKGAIVTGKRILSSDFARIKTDYWYGFKSIEDGVKKKPAKKSLILTRLAEPESILGKSAR